MNPGTVYKSKVCEAAETRGFRYCVNRRNLVSPARERLHAHSLPFMATSGNSTAPSGAVFCWDFAISDFLDGCYGAFDSLEMQPPMQPLIEPAGAMLSEINREIC